MNSLQFESKFRPLNDNPTQIKGQKSLDIGPQYRCSQKLTCRKQSRHCSLTCLRWLMPDPESEKVLFVMFCACMSLFPYQNFSHVGIGVVTYCTYWDIAQACLGHSRFTYFSPFAPRSSLDGDVCVFMHGSIGKQCNRMVSQ